MGGDTISVPGSSIDDDDLSTIRQIPDRFTETSTPWQSTLPVDTAEENESVFRESDTRNFHDSYKTLEGDSNRSRMRNVYAQVFKNYGELQHRLVNVEVAKRKILSYTAGSWVENVGGKTMSDYEVPKTTTLLLIGPKGSGKSSLVNRTSRVFEDDKFAPERAQVTYNSGIGNGTIFLQEYMIPRNSTSFCLYDTRSFSDDPYENIKMIKRWMTRGVSHGELVKSGSDASSLSAIMKHTSHPKVSSYERRTVNFVIFVVNGLSVLKCVDSNGADTHYAEMVAEIFSSPFLSFKDHKPAIAITHGDLLSLSERARVRVYLGELLGVHPIKQTFDIPDNSDPITELTIIDMIRYALEHADRNLPCKTRPMISKGFIFWPWTFLVLLLAVGSFIFTSHLHGFPSLKVHADGIPDPNLDINMGFAESIPKPGPERNEVFTDGILKSVLETEKVHSQQTPEPNPDLNEVFIESIPKQSPETNEVFRDDSPKPRLKLKKGRTKRITEPDFEIDWKKIRHLWYK